MRSAAPATACVPRLNLVRTTAFRLTVLYLALFSASVLAILGFIYWSTVAVLDRQTRATIEAEVKGLAEQYKERGLAGLIDVVRDRSGEGGGRDSVYLLFDPQVGPLAGNLAAWPTVATGPGEWITLDLMRREEGRLMPHEVHARTFQLLGGYRMLVGRDMYEKTKFRRIVVETLAWSLAATLGLGLVGGVILSRRMLARVEGVTRTARRIMQGDLSQRIEPAGSDDEFDRLAESLNAMFEQIERLMAGMRLATDSLAHDLRGPLTRLRGRIELALIHPPDPALDRNALNDVLSQTDAALAMFDSLLKIAAAEAGVATTELKPLDLGALARDAAELYEPLAEEKGIRLDIETRPAPRVAAQRELLAQAVANLLDNAVKHTPAGGAITVRVVEDGGGAMLTIADTGPGIPAVDRERVLERFVRLQESRSGPGAGLGLSLVAAVAKLHGAHLRLDDNPAWLTTERAPLAAPGTAGPGLSIEICFPPAPEQSFASAAQ
ncbi:MAG: HAMP domain-containing histidine kinase [Rhodospirillales bacterium]|nr:HAMP domain-containing histidine kinase [Rhodospirillales bacterium]